MSTRRRFIRQAVGLGASGLLGNATAAATAALSTTPAEGAVAVNPGVSLPTVAAGAGPVSWPAPGTAVPLLDAASHPKFTQALPNPLSAINRFVPTGPGTNAYTLRIREFQSNIGLVDTRGRALTTVLWGYGTDRQPPTSPARTFSVRTGSSIQVTYINELLNGNKPLAHRLPVDTTLMWANPGNLGGQAPVPLVAHRHGGAETQGGYSDGLPDAWATPDANGDRLPDFRGRMFSTPYFFANAQEAGHLWFHDHALGVTRLNVSMGLAGNYLIRDANEDYLIQRNMLPAPAYELPLMIQDKMFDWTGKVFYPSSDKENYPDAPAITHLPEFFGDFILVNGVPWPRCDVEPRAYRLRMLNASDSRFYRLKFMRRNGGALGFFQVGTELGLMDAPVQISELLLAPGERADIVINFAGVRHETIVVTNSANAPFPDGDPVDPRTSGKIMAFAVSLPLDTSQREPILPAFLRPLNGMLPALRTDVPTRKLMLLEGTDQFGRLQTMLGTVAPAGEGNPTSPAYGTFLYSEPVTENIRAGATEIWELHNTTVDAHPVHLHLVDFRILNREPFTGTVVEKPMTPRGTVGGYLTNVALSGNVRPAERNEAGRKDTVITYPGEVTRILVNFARAGEFVWHCHILSHEDHEMMRRFIVT